MCLTKFYNREQGMTLIEVLITLVILGLLVAVLVPMSLMIAKNLRYNKIKLTASQIASATIEREIASTTTQNYSQRPTGYTSWTTTLNGIVFTVVQDIEWKNDPADDSSTGNDPIPFDYKTIRVTVSAPDAFSGTVTEYADYRTFIAREGGEEPFAGIEVSVKRGWDQSPIDGAVVTLSQVAGGSSYTLATDEDGRALQPLDTSLDGEGFKVSVSAPGLMMLPKPQNNNTITANQFMTGKITVEMEEPETITLNLPPQHAGGEINLVYPPETAIDGYEFTKTVAPGQTSVSYAGLWPLGSDGTHGWPGVYKAEIALKAYAQDFSSSNGGYSRWREKSIKGISTYENMWLYSGSQGWSASPANYLLVIYYPEGQNRLVSPGIDLSPYVPKPGFTFTGSLSWQQNLLQGASGLPALVKKSRDGANPDGSSGTWLDVLTSCPDGMSTQMAVLETGDMVSNFRLLFEASPYMLLFQIEAINLECQYSREIQAIEPGQVINLAVAGGS